MTTIIESPATASLRHHPDLGPLLMASQGRFLNEQELATCEAKAPEMADRIQAYREMLQLFDPIVQEMTTALHRVYPMTDNADLTEEKTYRDTVLALQYIGLAMLLNDRLWLQDQLLHWMRTILESFRFPDKRSAESYLLEDESWVQRRAQVKPWMRCVYEAYAFVYQEMRKTMSDDAFVVMAPYIETTIETLCPAVES